MPIPQHPIFSQNLINHNNDGMLEEELSCNSAANLRNDTTYYSLSRCS